jgi:hypothetical protein
LHDIAKRWHIFKTGFFGKGAGALASPVKAGNHAHSMLAKNGGASMPHITGHQNGNAIKDFVSVIGLAFLRERGKKE